MQATLQTTTTFSIEGYRTTEYKGLVRGIVVRSPTIGQGILGGLKQIIDGQIGAYTEMCEQARQQAYGTVDKGVTLHADISTGAPRRSFSFSRTTDFCASPSSRTKGSRCGTRRR